MGLLADAPHLSCPIVKDIETGVHVVSMLVQEMERRINLEDRELYTLPYIVCIIDEYVSFKDRVSKQKPELLTNISNLLRRGRKAKIHMILATQDPTRKSMEAEIGNITSRMAFACANYQTSVAVLNRGGAEKLSGKGAMLFQSKEDTEPRYIQGAYIQEEATIDLMKKLFPQMKVFVLNS